MSVFKYIAVNLHTFEMSSMVTRYFFAVSVARSTETHMFVSGQGANTVLSPS